MPKRPPPGLWTQLATRIPKRLHRALRLHCVRADMSMMDFIVEALETKLVREARRARRQTA